MRRFWCADSSHIVPMDPKGTTANAKDFGFVRQSRANVWVVGVGVTR